LDQSGGKVATCCAPVSEMRLHLKMLAWNRGANDAASCTSKSSKQQSYKITLHKCQIRPPKRLVLEKETFVLCE